jgi:hypothetical protein
MNEGGHHADSLHLVIVASVSALSCAEQLFGQEEGEYISYDRMCRQRGCGGQLVEVKRDGAWVVLRCRKCGWEIKE